MSGGFAPRRQVLGNGLTVLHQHNPASAAVSMSLRVPGGAVHEPASRAGLATLMARGLTRGTTTRSKADIGEVLDFRGAHMSGSAGRHSAALSARCRAEDFEVVLDLMADAARNSVFPEAEVAKLVGDRLTSLREQDDDPAAVVEYTLREQIYAPGHPYSQRLSGTLESVAGIDAEALRAAHAAAFRASAALLVVAGNVEAERAVQGAEAALGDWPPRAGDAGYRAMQPVIPDAPPLSPSRRVVTLANKAQVDVAVGHAGIRRNDARYWPARLLNTILGRFAMGGRLGRSVREEQGMAYYTYSGLDAGLGPGPFTVRAGVAPGHVDGALSSIVAEIEQIRTGGVSAEELADAQAATVRSLPMALESNEGLADILHQIELFDLGWDYLERYPALANAVDRDAVREAALGVLHPEALCTAIAGPYPQATGGSQGG